MKTHPRKGTFYVPSGRSCGIGSPTTSDIEYGKRFQGYEEHEAGVTAFFEDGTSAAGSVLVGADGTRSVGNSASPSDSIAPLTSFRSPPTAITAEFRHQLHSSRLHNWWSCHLERAIRKAAPARSLVPLGLRRGLPFRHTYWVYRRG
jgi:2-polyprenyl-6-methoxyphenol hydroxylase-like FAD-dependent oxidoreductase